MNILINNEPLTRAIHLARVGRFGVCVLFQDNVSLSQRNAVNHFVGQHCNLVPLEQCHIAVEYCIPDADSYINKMYDKRPNPYWETAMNAKPLALSQIPTTLDKACETLLKTAYDRLGYEPVDVERILEVARCAALLGDSKNLRVEDLAEAIHYRAFDRELLVKDKRSWTADELSEIFGTLQWSDKWAKKRLTFENSDELSGQIWAEYEGMMWGWQDALQNFREKLGLTFDVIKTENQEFSPSTNGWYICIVDGQPKQLLYNHPNNFWIALDGKTYKPEQVIWFNDNL